MRATVGRADEGAHVFDAEPSLISSGSTVDPNSRTRTASPCLRRRTSDDQLDEQRDRAISDPDAQLRPTRCRSEADILDLAPVIPVVVVDSVEQAVPLARALLRGGIPGDRDDPAQRRGSWRDRGGRLRGRGDGRRRRHRGDARAGAAGARTPGRSSSSRPAPRHDCSGGAGQRAAPAGRCRHADRDAHAGRGWTRGDEVLPRRGERGRPYLSAVSRAVS